MMRALPALLGALLNDLPSGFGVQHETVFAVETGAPRRGCSASLADRGSSMECSRFESIGRFASDPKE